MTTDTTSYRIANNLYLSVSKVPQATAYKVVETPTNHIAVVDCSGSMGADLPLIRKQFKQKLPKLLRDGDTVSVVWFSGRGEYGTLLEAEPVASLKDLSDVEKAIDRWLRPIGLTGFKEPFEEVAKLTERIVKKYPNPCSLFFLSDGQDNQWKRTDILDAVQRASGSLAAATFVEYGYYADRNLLASMAETAGGTLIFSEDFDKYDPVFDAAMQNRPVGGKRLELPVRGDPVGGFAFTLSDGNIITYTAAGGKVSVPENTKSFMYLTPSSVGTAGGDLSALRSVPEDSVLASSYAALSLYAVRMKSDVIFSILKSLGDVKFIKQFTNCFGKQKYSDFTEAAKEAAFHKKARYQEGYDPSLVPAEDAFTVLDLLNVLSGDKENKVVLDHPDFKYSRISRARTEADENFSAEEQEAIAAITAKMSTEKNAKKLKELQAELGAVAASKKDALKFIADPAPAGYSFSALTLNEERPNISFLVRKTGVVDISSRLATAAVDITSKITDSNFKTFIFRNYAVVKDGLVNIEKLPVRLTRETWKTLLASDHETFGRIQFNVDADGMVALTIPLRQLPVINRKMVREVSAKTLFELEWQLTKARAAQKVYNTYHKEKFGRKSEGFKLVYGDTTADWLVQHGLTDYSGFSPKMVQAESTDVYMGKELTVSLKGYSSLPSVKEVKEKMGKGKELTGGAALMATTITEVEQFIKDNPSTVYEKWFDGKIDTAVATVRGLISQMAKIKFSVVVGQVWFNEFKSLDENTLTLKLDGKDIVCKVDMKEVEIKI